MKARLKLNSKGVRALLNSPEVRTDLRRRGDAILHAAGPSKDFVAHERATRTRPRVTVITASYEGRKAEAKNRALTRAISAGR